SGVVCLDVRPEEEEMAERFCLFAGLAALLLFFFVVTSQQGSAPDAGKRPPTPFGPKWLAHVRDDVPRLEIWQGRRSRPTQELLAHWTGEYDAQFREARCKIRKG